MVLLTLALNERKAALVQLKVALILPMVEENQRRCALVLLTFALNELKAALALLTLALILPTLGENLRNAALNERAREFLQLRKHFF